MQAVETIYDEYGTGRPEPNGLFTVQDTGNLQALLRYNTALQEQGQLIRLNEGFLESKLEELTSISPVSGPLETLILARLTELALICAGNYADNGCIGEFGDLMFNPRLIHVHIRGKLFPVKKERHTGLTVQFKHQGQSRGSVIEWLKSNTTLETVKEPILPLLVDLLEKRGCARPYLESVRDRISRAVTLTCRLAASRIPEGMGVDTWISSLRETDRRRMEELLCRFDNKIFNDLNEVISRVYT